VCYFFAGGVAGFAGVGAFSGAGASFVGSAGAAGCSAGAAGAFGSSALGLQPATKLNALNTQSATSKAITFFMKLTSSIFYIFL
jgi:hypothetical protein